MQPIEKDRITLAWELRRDIHAWLTANSRAVMVEIFEAFSHRKRETVRKAVIRMRTDGDVAMVGQRRACNEGIYAAITTAIKPESKKREGLARGARSNQHLAAAASRKPITQKERQRRDSQAAKKAPPAPVAAAEPWRTVHIGGQMHASQAGSGGQGALRRPVTISCSWDF